MLMGDQLRSHQSMHPFVKLKSPLHSSLLAAIKITVSSVGIWRYTGKYWDTLSQQCIALRIVTLQPCQNNVYLELPNSFALLRVFGNECTVDSLHARS